MVGNWITLMMRIDIRLISLANFTSPPSLGLKMEIVNFIMGKFPKQQREKNTRAKTTRKCKNFKKISRM